MFLHRNLRSQFRIFWAELRNEQTAKFLDPQSIEVAIIKPDVIDENPGRFIDQLLESGLGVQPSRILDQFNHETAHQCDVFFVEDVVSSDPSQKGLDFYGVIFLAEQLKLLRNYGHLLSFQSREKSLFDLYRLSPRKLQSRTGKTRLKSPFPHLRMEENSFGSANI